MKGGSEGGRKAREKRHLFVPMASSSSMKIIAGAFSFAKAKASRTNLEPSPINIYYK